MSKKRFVDIGRKFKVDSHLYGHLIVPKAHACVVYPNCSKMGNVTSDENNYYFKCHSCVKRTEVPRYKSEYVVKGKCEPCASYFRTTDEENLKHFKVLRVNCPRCGTFV